MSGVHEQNFREGRGGTRGGVRRAVWRRGGGKGGVEVQQVEDTFQT